MSALSKDEWSVIKDLLQLYHASWDKGPCRRGCKCDFCSAVENAGEHSAAVFDSLREKVEAGEMSTPNDGGKIIDAQSGMSLRDWFAGQAIGDLISQISEDVMIRLAKETTPEDVTTRLGMAAYMIADYMIKAREWKP